MNSRQQIFTAESSAHSPRQVLAGMARGMRSSPYIAYRLVLKDVRSEYAKSALGIFWDFADPLVLGVTFYLLRQSNIINPGDLSMPYSVFMIYGLLLFLTFSDAVLLSTNMMVRAKGLLAHTRIPPEAMIQSVFFRVLFNLGFRLAVMLLFSVALYSSAKANGLSAFSPAGFAAFVIACPLLILSGMSVGTLLAPFQVIYNDVTRIVRLVLVPLRFASPVMWILPATGPFAVLNRVNPVSPLIDGLRALATQGTLPDAQIFFGVSAAFAALFLLAWFVFHLTVPVLADK